MPMMMKSIDVPIFNHFSGSFVSNFAPSKTANAVNVVKAIIIPTNTKIGCVSAAKVIPRIWLLSPSSINAMSEKLVSIGKFAFSAILVSSLPFLNHGKMPKSMKTIPEITCMYCNGRRASKGPPTARLIPSIARKASIAPAKTCVHLWLHDKEITAN